MKPEEYAAKFREALEEIKKKLDDLPGTTRNDYDAGYKAAIESCGFIAEEALKE